jgi:hypothetical protein
MADERAGIIRYAAQSLVVGNRPPEPTWRLAGLSSWFGARPAITRGQLTSGHHRCGPGRSPACDPQPRRLGARHLRPPGSPARAVSSSVTNHYPTDHGSDRALTHHLSQQTQKLPLLAGVQHRQIKARSRRLLQRYRGQCRPLFCSSLPCHAVRIRCQKPPRLPLLIGLAQPRDRVPSDSRPQTAERRNNLAITRNSVADRTHSVENPPSDERRNAHTDDGLVSVAKKMLQPVSRTMGCGKVIAKLTVRGNTRLHGPLFFPRFR